MSTTKETEDVQAAPGTVWRKPTEQAAHAKRKKEQRQGRVWCRVGNHEVNRNLIVVHYEPGFGLCGPCLVQRTDKVRNYWTGGRSYDSHCDAAGVPCSTTP